MLEGSWVPTVRTKHFDLWSRVLPLVLLLRPLVSLCKVSSHLDPSLECTAGDEWCAAHNNHVDAAANRSQLQRADAFLEQWRGACHAWDAELHVTKEVLALHLRVGQRATRTRPVREPTLAVERPIPDLACHLGQGNPGQVPGFSRKYGNGYTAAFVQFAECLADPESPIRWVSTVQLFFAFCLRFQHRLVYKDGNWVDLQVIPSGRYVQVVNAKRIRYFARHLREYAHEAGGVWLLVQGRPSSPALQVKLSVVPVRLQDSLYRDTEAFLQAQLPRGSISGSMRSWIHIALP